MAVMAYADDHDDIYPVAAPFVGNAMLDWEKPLIALEYLPSLRAVDPDGFREYGGSRFAFSGALMHPASQMEPGTTVPIDLARTIGVEQSRVGFPSQKGMLVRWVIVERGDHVFWTWNPYQRPLAPVAFCDASVRELRCTDFRLAHDFFENWVGYPVLSTWSGAGGIDQIEH